MDQRKDSCIIFLFLTAVSLVPLCGCLGVIILVSMWCYNFRCLGAAMRMFRLVVVYMIASMQKQACNNLGCAFGEGAPPSLTHCTTYRK